MKLKIALIDVDSHNFPNLPLMKISAFLKKQGHFVEFCNPFEKYDIAYISKVFTNSKDIAYTPQAPRIFKGGTGYNFGNDLPSCIENVFPDYSLYPQYDEAYGFLTRGCPRNCGFCIVSKKEGRISKQVATIDNFWSGQKTIKLLDPNLLACKERDMLLSSLQNSKVWIDFTQGLDIRFADEDVIKLLNGVKTKLVHFAWDNPKEDLTAYFQRFNKLSNIKDMRKKAVYVLTNFNSSHEEDLYRVDVLKKLNFNPYIMIYNKENAPLQTRHLQRWVNNKRIFSSCATFKEYDSKRG